MLLPGCALLPSGFDSMEHSYLVTINQLSADVTVCDDHAAAVMTSQQITAQARWLRRYGASLPRNGRLHEMEQKLLDMSLELSERYRRGPVSATYCRGKLANIHQATETIVDISAQRPRL
jgi:hypothetical protein